MARQVKATVEGSWSRYWYVRLTVPTADHERLTLASFGSRKDRACAFRNAWNARYALDFNADALQARIDYRKLLHDAEALKQEILKKPTPTGVGVRNLALPTTPHPQVGGLGGLPPQREGNGGLLNFLRRKSIEIKG